ncbi:plasmid replication protein, CyRepA1 family, partial [Coleofasciculus sp. H7-2]|uniref:plasmid replication protein, CyRepA1 family n=1 Tax=Coleofasciculus sp. H7-2 TaxID=3351545 RepID=UPI00366EB916
MSLPNNPLSAVLVGGERCINQHHFDEWRASAVDDTITALNVRSLLGSAALNAVFFSPSLNRVNTGRVSRGLLRLYSHLEKGIWFCCGLDPLDTWREMEWGVAKPDCPRVGKKGNLIKYESPPGAETRAIFLRVSLSVWEAIAARYNVSMPEVQVFSDGEAIGFWAWVLQNNVPIVITEGAKKTASLLSAGFAAIAVPGIWNGRRVLKDGTGILIPELELFATKDRIIYFAFDSDEKPKAVAAVKKAIAKTGKLFISAGCRVKVITWNSSLGKGADDFIVANGAAAFEQVYSDALSLKQWQWHNRPERNLTWVPNVSLNTNDLSTVGFELPDSGIIAVQSGKGTGKTKLIAKAVAEAKRLLSLTHRVFLGRSLAKRLRYTWRNDADKGIGNYLDASGRPTNRIGSCVESLIAIDPQKFVGCDLVIDEVCQVIKNLLTSSTCQKDGRRPALLARLHWLVKVAKRVIIADADLNDFAIDYIKKLRGDDSPVFLIRNDYQSTGYPCKVYESPSYALLLERAARLALEGKKIFIAMDSKKTSKLVEALTSDGVQSGRILVVNGDTSGEAEQRQYINEIHNCVDKYDILIATGSLATGVSIELPWFDEVIGIFEGISSDGDIAQALARVRDPVPRHIWISKTGKNFNSATKAEYASITKRELKTRYDREVLLIRSSLNPDLLPFVDAPIDWDNCPHKQMWAQTVSADNSSMWNLREYVIARLRHEGNNVQILEGSTDDIDLDFKAQVKEIKIEIDTARHEAVAKATILAPEEKEQLQAREALSTGERANLQKTAIAEFTCTTEVDSKLAKQFPNLMPAILRYEDFYYNLAIERVERAIARQAKWKAGLFIPDIPCREQERFIRERLGLQPLIERLKQGETLGNEDLREWADKVRANYRQVNEVLRLGFSPDSKKWSNVRIFNQLTKQLGIPTETKRSGKGDARVTTTSLDREQWDFILDILERREAKRQLSLQEKVLAAVPMEVDEGRHRRIGTNGSYKNNQVPLVPMEDSPKEMAEQGTNGSYKNNQVPLVPM